MLRLKLYSLKEQIKRNLAKFWYWLMKPIAYFFTIEKERKRYDKKEAKITKKQAVKWIAEDIVRYVIKHKTYVEILICESANEEYFDVDCTLANHRPYYLRRGKTRMAYHKFKMTIDLQEEIIDYIKRLKIVFVTENVEKFPSWYRINDYKKTVLISFK